MKKLVALLSLALLCLAGCGEKECVEHQWEAATCERPATCTVCGQTEGAALGHNWQAADCISAKICTVCSATEGEALGHDWQPANYQTPAICKACSITEGTCLEPGFAEHNVEVITVQLGVQYDYLAACYVQGYTTLGKVSWDDYQIFDGDEAHPAMEGYQWHSVTLQITFSDRNALKYGFVVNTALDDYYWYATQTGDGYNDQFSVFYQGKQYDQCLRANGQGSVSEWVDNTCVYTATFAWRVPVDYDGHLILLHNGAGDLEEKLQTGSEDILVFKFQ